MNSAGRFSKASFTFARLGLQTKAAAGSAPDFAPHSIKLAVFSEELDAGSNPAGVTSKTAEQRQVQESPGKTGGFLFLDAGS